MKLAYLTADAGIPLDGTKGASIHLREMAAALARVGHEVVLGGVRGWKTARLPGVSIAGLPKVAELETPPAIDDAARRETELLVGNLARSRRLDSLLPGDLDAVLERWSLWSLATAEWARARGIPYLLEVNAPLIEEHARYRGLTLEALARGIAHIVFSAADRVLVVSPPLRDYAIDLGAPPGAVEVLPNGVDIERFQPRVPDAAGLPGLPAHARDRLRVGFLGSLKPWHGLEGLLEAWPIVAAQRPDVHLSIIGEGPARRELEELVARSGCSESITFHGALAHEAIPEALAALHVTVAPYPRIEPFYFSPLKILESFAAARPVVTSRIGHLPELLRGERAGYLYQPGDADGLARVLVGLRREELSARGRAARELAVEQSWDASARRVSAMIEELTRLPQGEPA